MSKKIAIIGAGNSGLTMAAYLSKHKHDVSIWNRSSNNISELIKNKTIKISGIINGEFAISEVGLSLEKTVKNAKWIFITTPANSHKEILIKLSKYVEPQSIVILSPGRTFGIIEAEKIFSKNNKNNIIAESQTIVFTCRKITERNVNLIKIKNNVLLSTKKIEDTHQIINDLPDCLKNSFKIANSFLETSLGNVGMILHVAPLLLNIGWVESDNTKFKYYYEGITPSVARLLQKLDDERLEVAKKLNFNIISLIDWFAESYNVKANNIYDCIKKTDAYNDIDAPKTLQHRYLYEDVSTGLVPLAYIGKQLGLDLKITNLIIDLASEVLNYNFRQNGRKINLTDLF